MSASPQDDLQGYFDELLAMPQVAPVAAPQPERPWQEPEPEPLTDLQAEARQKLARLLKSAPADVREAVAAPVVPAVTAEAVAEVQTPRVSSPVRPPQDVVQPALPVAAVEEPVAESSASTDLEVALGWAENGRPHWAQERFDVLLFSVSGLTLAVPLIALGQIQPLTDELTPLFGQADWFMGLQPTPMGKIRTINTSRFVMPERYREELDAGLRYVISIDGCSWGLAVDSVNQPITLQPEDVKWRTERGKRPWLAGTVKQHMCALLDVATMRHLLQQADMPGAGYDPLKS